MRCKRILLSLAIAATIGGYTCHPSQVHAQGKVQAKPVSSQRAALPANVAERQNAAELIDATINGSPITRDELAALCLPRYGAQVIDNIVNKHLILQACQSQNIRISQKDVDDEISRIAGKFKLSTNMYLKLIAEERDITPEQYSADIVWPMLALRQLARDKVTVDPSQITREIESQFGRKVQVRMIVVKDKNKAADIHKQAIANPESFKALAKQHSEDPVTASVEGLLPPIRNTNTEDVLEKVAFGLKPNQVSDLFTIGDMTVMLQCVRFIEASILTQDQMQYHEAQIRSELEDLQLREIADSMFGNLREQANVHIVFNDSALSAQYPGVAAILNGQPIPLKVLEDECIKRFGPSVLEVEINRRILLEALTTNKVNVTNEDLMAEIARTADYYGFLTEKGEPDVNTWLTKVMAETNVTQETYLQDAVWPIVALRKLVADKVTVTEEDLKAGYERDYGPRAEVLAIVCSNQRTAQEVWQLARDNPTEQFFGELAAQYSVEPTSRSNLGKIPPIRRESGQSTLEQAAFKLQVGELSGIVEVNGQYIILKGQGRTQPVVTDPARVEDELRKVLLEENMRVAMNQHMNHLVASASIDNFLVPKAQLGPAATKASLQQLNIPR